MAKKKSAVTEIAVARAKTPIVAELPAVAGVPPEQMAPMQGAILSASAIQIVWAGNDCTVVFSRPRPLVAPDGKTTHAVGEIVAMIQLSAGTMKDMSIVVSETIQEYEKVYGSIETQFTKQRAAKKKPVTKH